MTKPDCKFYYFKPGGKWKYEGEGVFPSHENLGLRPEVYYNVDHDSIFKANGCMPGIIGDGKYLTVVVIPNEDCQAKWAYPRMIRAVREED